MTSQMRRGRRGLLALALALVAEGWLALGCLPGAERWFGILLVAAAVPVVALAHRPRACSRRQAPQQADEGPSATTDAVGARRSSAAPTRAARTTSNARGWVLGLLVAAVVLGGVGQYLGGEHGPLRHQGYVVDIVAGLTAALVGLAIALIVLGAVAADHAGGRSLRDARTLAGRLVGDMLATGNELVVTRAPGADWRRRGRQVVDDLQDVARRIDGVREQLTDRTGHDVRSPTVARVAALQDRWSAIVRPWHGTSWRRLEHTWSIMEADVRPRLMTAGDWVPGDTALRVRELVHGPGAPDRHPRLLDDVDVTDGTVDADPAELQAVLAASREYVDRVLVLTIALLDLGELYEPPASTTTSNERTAPSSLLGTLSAIAVEVNLTPAVASAAGATVSNCSSTAVMSPSTP